MFRKKRKARRTESRSTLYGADTAIVCSGPTAEFALLKKTVLKSSAALFNDPEPCAIHPGAVHCRAMMELMEPCPAGEAVSISILSERQKSCFAPNAAVLCIGESEK